MTASTTPSTGTDALARYLDAGAGARFDELIGFYSADFVNLRLEADGTVTVLSREQLVAALRLLESSGSAMGPADDVRVLADRADGPDQVVWFTRDKPGGRRLYEFRFRLDGARPLLRRELTVAIGAVRDADQVVDARAAGTIASP